MRVPLTRLFIFFIGFFSGASVMHFYMPKAADSVAAESMPAPECPENQTSQSSLESKPEDIRLAAPQFGRSGVLDSNSEGVIFVNWIPVEGAQEYLLTVTDEDDQVLQKFRISRHKTSIKDLVADPTKAKTFYRLRVHAVDENGALGHPSEIKKLAMISVRNLKPPTIKNIKTE